LSREGNLAIINHVTKSIIWSTHYARNANQWRVQRIISDAFFTRH
jgi:hypothetical protein